MPWLVMLIPYFGPWPQWINYFMASCGANTNIRWKFFSDNDPPESAPTNAEFRKLSLDDYRQLISSRLSVRYSHADAYKTAEARPSLGYLFADEIAEFEFFGYGDIDVIWGDIDRVYSSLRTDYDVISANPTEISGHLAVFRNTPEIREAFFRIPNFRELLERDGFQHMDEVHIAKIFMEDERLAPRALFRDQYTTVLSPRGWRDGTRNFPRVWFWRDGRLTNDKDGDEQCLYLHFMRWKSLRWAPSPPAETEGAWMGLKSIVSGDWREGVQYGFAISAQGIHNLRDREASFS
jgi:hypothetical protein